MFLYKLGSGWVLLIISTSLNFFRRQLKLSVHAYKRTDVRMYACFEFKFNFSSRPLQQLDANKTAHAAAAGQIDLVRGFEPVGLLILDEMRAEAAR